ncbi:hypothetical protein [Ruminococcus sp.]|uniref:hypothetical protein n=1 Tax=Ruminococcus sp. TaxID=41978 RepID=UPI002E7FDCE6|nr:hypothetical protein [Ruminococcus sp.]MEE3440586.1 hypothetical protein [Ruminococcus sp.]
MNKILKILSILVIGFVMFSCSTPTNDPETPAPNPEVQTYSITFKVENSAQQPVADFLNSLPDYKNLKEGTEVELLTIVYATEENKCTFDSTATFKVTIYYEDDVTSVRIGNENIEIKVERLDIEQR